ncbi:unnamed protein product [Cunninghamella blakesleeana]
MLMKYNYLLATLFIYLNIISNVFGCQSTTLTIWKSISQTTTANGVDAYLEAKLVVRDEGSREFTGSNKKKFKESERYKYKNMYSSDKKFGLYASFYPTDLTYTWKGRSEYVAGPVKTELEGMKTKYTYYGCI